MKQKNRYSNTALIDADYIIWIACNKNKVLDSQGQPKKDEKGRFIYKDKTVEEALNTCDSYISDILNITHSDSYILFLTASRNFRYEIDSSYKANRVGMEKPMWFNEVRAHMKEKWSAIDVQGLEADDLVSISLNNLENSFIIASDKDVLDCIPGKHFDTRKGRAGFIETTKDFADYAFARSILTGDSIDGISNIKQGYGIKTAEKELNQVLEGNFGMDALTAVSMIYKKHLGEHDGIIKFSKQYQLLKILDSFYQIPVGTNFEIPEPICWNCTETILSEEIINNYEE